MPLTLEFLGHAMSLACFGKVPAAAERSSLTSVYFNFVSVDFTNFYGG